MVCADVMPASMPMAPFINGASLLIAKSEGDEALEEVFLNFPLIMTGAVLGGFVVQYAKANDVELPATAVVPAVAVATVVASKTGVLSFASGLLAKTALDIWNLFAGLVLQGAILKYD